MSGTGSFRTANIAFTTPDFTGASTKIEFTWENTSVASESDTIRYALLSSDSNINKYVKTKEDVADDNQITKGLWEEPISTSTKNLTIETNVLDPNATYYLVLWAAEKPSTRNSTIGLSWGDKVTVNLVYEDESGVVHIGADGYCCYIEDGTKFIEVVPYIDNGTSYEPYA